MHPYQQHLQSITRRELLGRLGTSIGSLALAALLKDDARGNAPASAEPHTVRQPHFPARAKSVIFLHMVGAPSHLDLFEHKPVLTKFDGKPVPKELIEGQRFAFLRGRPNLLGTRFNFKKHGQSGLELSEMLPHLARVADDVTVIKTLRTEEFNHGPAQLFFQTGFGMFGRPSFGSWVSYGLGSENQNLPGFVVLVTGPTAGAGNALWGSGFLPTVHQGVQFRNQGDPVLFLSNPDGIEKDDRRRLLDSIQELNKIQQADVGDPEIATRISQYELAFRMQTAVPELTDLSKEPRHVHELYGTTPGKASFANHCLLARRLVERGVRFVQLYDADWDHHANVFTSLPKKCQEIDRPAAALIMDLKQRGLLDSTLVVWGGEFGRTPMLQGAADKNAGRDHHKDAFCCWLAGGGIRPGLTYGKTDDLGYHSIEDPMHVHDLHATLLHLLGLDHEKLTFKYQGRPFRLTDVSGVVAEKLLA